MTRMSLYGIRLIAAALLVLTPWGTSAVAQNLGLAPQSILPATHKSPGTAFLLSLSATAIPLLIANSVDGTAEAFTMVAIFTGPAAGHFYAGKPRRAMVGLGIRAGLIALTAAAAQAECQSSSFICIPPAAAIGGLAVLTSMVGDIVTAPASARHFNEEHFGVAIVPLQNGPEKRLGVGIRATF